MSVAVTAKPACAMPMACVPTPQEASSTAPRVRPRSRRSPVMIPASQAMVASQSAKIRW